MDLLLLSRTLTHHYSYYYTAYKLCTHVRTHACTLFQILQGLGQGGLPRHAVFRYPLSDTAGPGTRQHDVAGHPDPDPVPMNHTRFEPRYRLSRQELLTLTVTLTTPVLKMILTNSTLASNLIPSPPVLLLLYAYCAIQTYREHKAQCTSWCSR